MVCLKGLLVILYHCMLLLFLLFFDVFLGGRGGWGGDISDFSGYAFKSYHCISKHFLISEQNVLNMFAIVFVFITLFTFLFLQMF